MLIIHYLAVWLIPDDDPQSVCQGWIPDGFKCGFKWESKAVALGNLQTQMNVIGQAKYQLNWKLFLEVVYNKLWVLCQITIEV